MAERTTSWMPKMRRPSLEVVSGGVSLKDRMKAFSSKKSGDEAASAAPSSPGKPQSPGSSSASAPAYPKEGERLLKAGLLKRSGNGVLAATFLSRHCFLYSEAGAGRLCFFEDKLRSTAKGTLLLTKGMTVSRAPKNPLELVLDGPAEEGGGNKTLKLRLATELELVEWLQALEAALPSAEPPQAPEPEPTPEPLTPPPPEVPAAPLPAPLPPPRRRRRTGR